MSTRDYSSIYSIKEFALKEIAPKYFDLNEIAQANIGLLGYTTELIANTTEDTFNSISNYVREIFPNIAQFPETLYNYATILQIDDLMAVPAEMNQVLFINEKDILTLGTKKENVIEFVLDSNLVIDVEGKQFMLDYDVIITAKPHRGDYIYTAIYDFNFKNSMSDIVNPYIKTMRIRRENNTKYLGILVKTRRVNRFEQVEYIINNDKINLPTISFEFNDQLANFEVFYKAPDSSEYVQLKKRMFNLPPIKDPFCYYRIKDENKVELSFTLRDNYFQPKFNSEILIRYYTTTGSDGNFPLYKGENIVAIPKSDVYDYNNNIIIFPVAQSESRNGRDRLTLEELRSKIIERTATSGAYNNENDLQLFFSSVRYKNNAEVLFIKKRDDALERLFSSFALFRDPNNDIYSTNTLNLNLFESDFDLEYEQSSRFILKPGHLFRYVGSSLDLVEIISGRTLKDDFSDITEEFLYTTPFLITVSKKPGIVGFYLNSLEEKIQLDYTYINSESPVQFICNTLSISRNALHGEDEYTLELALLPTSELEVPIADDRGNDLNNLKIIGVVEDTNGAEFCYFPFTLKRVDIENNLYIFEAKLNTDDYMTLQQKFRVFNLYNIETGVEEVKLIPMSDCKINFYTFYKYPDMKVGHKFDYFTDLEPYTLTNTYATGENRINFITPISMMRSQVKFHPYGATPTTYYMSLSFVPFVRALDMKDAAKFKHFLEILYLHYSFLEETLDKITNNFGIDMKFYNTYGRAKHFVIEENRERLNKTNCSIRFRVAPTLSASIPDLVRDLQIFIKDYVENINTKGYNSIYISNLIQAIKNQFKDVEYLKFVSINNYDSSVQVIKNRAVDIEVLTKDERRSYVPEYLTLKIEDIIIDIINTN